MRGPQIIHPSMTICYSETTSLCDSDVLHSSNGEKKSESQIANKAMQMNLLKYISSLFCFWLPIGTFFASQLWNLRIKRLWKQSKESWSVCVTQNTESDLCVMHSYSCHRFFIYSEVSQTKRPKTTHSVASLFSAQSKRGNFQWLPIMVIVIFQHIIGLNINCWSDGGVLSSSSNKINVAFIKGGNLKAPEINDFTFYTEHWLVYLQVVLWG